VVAKIIKRMITAIVAGLIGVFGVFVGVLVERLVQRYGKLRFVADKVAIHVRGDEISEQTDRGLVSRAVYGVPIDRDLLEAVEWLDFTVSIQFFNEKEVKTGLRDVAIIFKSRKKSQMEILAPVSAITRVTGASPERHRLDVLNLPSREWLSLEIGGSFHDSVSQEQILAFSEIDGAEFRGYFPDGREFRRKLEIWTDFSSM
jgi:hypothetical protein